MVIIEKKDRIDVVTFTVNSINALITDEVRDRISKVFDTANSKVIIDLSGVNYIDSTGFGCFLSIQKSARNNYGVLKFAHPEPPVMDLLRTLRLHTVLQIYGDMDSCLRSFS
jgi:anti-sigma B factor antagonist